MEESAEAKAMDAFRLNKDELKVSDKQFADLFLTTCVITLVCMYVSLLL